MAEIVPVQQCRSLDGWVPVEVESRTQPDVRYIVQTNPWGESSENICQCKGYTYRGTCAHQSIAANEICGWHELWAREKQDEEQRKSMTCPRCKGPSQWVMEVQDNGRTG